MGEKVEDLDLVTFETKEYDLEGVIDSLDFAIDKCKSGLFGATLPAQFPFFFLALAIYIIVSLSIGSILGFVLKNQAKLTMTAQLVFLPSIMLSGIMFPISLLPDFFEAIGRIFPASWGYRLILDHGFCLENLWYPIAAFFAAIMVCGIILKKQKAE